MVVRYAMKHFASFNTANTLASTKWMQLLNAEHFSRKQLNWVVVSLDMNSLHIFKVGSLSLNPFPPDSGSLLF